MRFFHNLSWLKKKQQFMDDGNAPEILIKIQQLDIEVQASNY